MVDRHWQMPPASDRPIFLLASGWRSGSTLLQRLVMSAGDVVIWGEPYAPMDLVRRLSDSLLGFMTGYPREDWVVRSLPPAGEPELWRTWIANICPDPSHLLEAHRAFLRRLYASPLAGETTTWGFKEVRLGVEHARYLKWVFPEARFVFLHRNPYDSYRSYRKWSEGYYESWPSRPIHSPAAFGEMWQRLTRGFLQRGAEVDGITVSYDELTREPSIVGKLDSHLGLRLDPACLDLRIDGDEPGAADRRAADRPQPISSRDWARLRRAVEPLASELGYRPA